MRKPPKVKIWIINKNQVRERSDGRQDLINLNFTLNMESVLNLPRQGIDMTQQDNYLFTLRCWGEDGHWRWSLKKSGEGTRIGFPDLDSLYLYLSRLTEGDESRPENDPAAQNEQAEPHEGSELSQGPSQPGEPHE
jgi:hypothetical protein